MAGVEIQQTFTDDTITDTKLPVPPKEMAKGDDEGKLFVGGLSWETTTEKLVDFMKKYGDIEACEIKMHPDTKRSRGFAFVKFKDPSSADAVLAGGPHNLDGRTIDPKKALPVGKQTMRTKKIFVGGLKQETTEEKLREYFQEKSMIKSIDFVIDPDTKRKRGFCFIELDSEDIVDELVKTQFHTIAGKSVEVKYAFSKEQQAQMASKGRGRGRQGGPPMYGGGYGAGGGYGGPPGGGRYGGGGGYPGMGGYGGPGQFYGGYGSYSDGYQATGPYDSGYSGFGGAPGGMGEVRYPDIHGGGRGGGGGDFGPMSSYNRHTYHPYSR